MEIVYINHPLPMDYEPMICYPCTLIFEHRITPYSFIDTGEGGGKVKDPALYRMKQNKETLEMNYPKGY